MAQQVWELGGGSGYNNDLREENGVGDRFSLFFRPPSDETNVTKSGY
jgi:hypothetical protein